jgi:hypothetical protein
MIYTLDKAAVYTTHHNHIDLVDQLSGITTALNDLREQQDVLVAQQQALLTEESVLLQEQAAIFAQLAGL